MLVIVALHLVASDGFDGFLDCHDLFGAQLLLDSKSEDFCSHVATSSSKYFELCRGWWECLSIASRVSFCFQMRHHHHHILIDHLRILCIIDALGPCFSEGMGLAMNACNSGLHLTHEPPAPWLTNNLVETAWMAFS